MLAELLKDSTIGQTHIAHFHKHGYVKLPGLLDRREIARLREAMCDAVRTFASSPNSYDVTAAADSFWTDEAVNDNTGSTQYDLDALAQYVRRSGRRRLVDPGLAGQQRGRFLLDTSVWRRVPALAELAISGPFAELAATLLEVGQIRFYDDQLFIKEAGAVDRAAFHQDFPYFHLSAPTGCVFWIPLDFVNPAGGRLGYVPGSHRWGEVYKPNIFISSLAFPGSDGADMPAVDDNPEAFGVQYIDMAPGDVLVHHFLTVHGSEGNSAGTPRRAFSLRYCDADLTYKQRAGAPAQPLHNPGAKNGDRLDDTVHPLAWPKDRRHLATVKP